jgi:hypothetical protein
MIPAPLLPPVAAILIALNVAMWCVSWRQGVNMESHANRWLMIDGRRVPFAE